MQNNQRQKGSFPFTVFIVVLVLVAGGFLGYIRIFHPSYFNIVSFTSPRLRNQLATISGNTSNLLTDQWNAVGVNSIYSVEPRENGQTWYQIATAGGLVNAGNWNGVLAYSGGAFDTDNDVAILPYGGGDADYQGTNVEAFALRDIPALGYSQYTWYQDGGLTSQLSVGPPSPGRGQGNADPLIDSNGLYPNWVTPDASGRRAYPNARHSYAGALYMPSVKKVYIGAGCSSNFGFGPTDPRSGGSGPILTVYFYDPNTKRVQYQESLASYGFSYGYGCQHVVAWDSLRQQVLIDDTDRLVGYNPTKPLGARVTTYTSGGNGRGINGLSIFDPKRNRMFVIGSDWSGLNLAYMHSFDASGSYLGKKVCGTDWNFVTTAAPHFQPCTSAGYGWGYGGGIVYDEIGDRYVIWQGGSSPQYLFFVNPDTLAVTEVLVPGLQLPAATAQGLWGRFFRSPKSDVFGISAYLTRNPEQAYMVPSVYLYKPSRTSPPPLPPPSVSLTSPTTGSTVSGTITVSANASDNIGVVGVQFKLDGTNLGAEVTNSPYSISWNTTQSSNGSHTLTATARDAAGNVGTAQSVTVTVNNITTPPPTPPPGLNLTPNVFYALPHDFKVGTVLQNGKHTSIALDPDDGRLYYMGGDYSDASWQTFGLQSYRQDIYSLDLPSFFNAGGGSAGWRNEVAECGQGLSAPPNVKFPDFGGWSWIPKWHQFLWVTGTSVASTSECPDETSTNYSDPNYIFNQAGAYDPVAKRWTWIGDNANHGNDASWVAPYDPVTDRVFKTNANGNGPTVSVSSKLPATPGPIGPWTDAASCQPLNPRIYGWAGNQTTMDVVGRKFYLIDTVNTGYAQMYAFDLDTWGCERVANPPGGGIPGWSTSNGVVATFDIPRRLLVYYNINLNKVYVYDPRKEAHVGDGSDPNGAWTELPITTIPANTPSWALFNRFAVYDARDDVHIFAGHDPNSPATTAPYTFLLRLSGTPPPPPPGPIPPTISLTSPTTGSTVSGTITVSANASDNIGVVGVQFKLDGSNLGAEDTSPPYAVSWDTTTASNGSHTLTATARDAAGNVGTAQSVTVTVNNAVSPPPPPPVPLACAPATQTVVVNAATSFSVSGGGAGASYTWHAPAGSPPVGSGTFFTNSYTTAGTYIVTVSLAGGSSQSTASCSVTVTPNHVIDTEPPTVPQGLTGSALSSSQITLSWNASTDNVGVTGYKIYRNGSAIATSPSLSYIDSNLFPATSYRYTVAAYDLAGNTSSQSGSVYLTTLSNNPPISPTPPTYPAPAPPPSNTTSLKIGISSPAVGMTVTGLLSLEANVSGDVGVLGLQFTVDGKPVGKEIAAPPYKLTWDTRAVTNGQHFVSAAVRDAAGNSGTGPNVSISVVNTGGPRATAPSSEEALSFGSRDASVKPLQQFLISQSILAPGNDTGYFGSLTRSAVIAFQQRYGIPATGVVESVTLAKINQLRGTAAPSPAPTPAASPPLFTRSLSRGLRNSDVVAVQRFLIAKGLLAPGNDTGYFGTLTEAAVQTFQCQQNIVCNGDRLSTGWGTVGRRTRAVLNGMGR